MTAEGINHYYEGTEVDIVLTFTNLAGVLESPSDASITHTEPDGTVTTYTEADAEFFEDSEGVFIYRHVPVEGRHRYRGFSTAGLKVAQRRQIMVRE